MGTLVEFRGWLRSDLNDPAGSTQRFSDGDLDRAVTRTVGELALVWPRVSNAELEVATAGRMVPLAAGSFPGLMGVEEVEWPYGMGGSEATYPAGRPAFRVAPDRASVALLVEEALPAGARVRVRVRWTSAHVVGVASTTVPAELDQLVARGAYGYACLAYSTPGADNFKYDDGATVAGVDDSMIPREWRARGNEALGEFKEGLERLRMQRGTGTSVVWTVDDD